MSRLLLTILFTVLPIEAMAICPTPWTGTTYPAVGNRVRFCAPETDTDGQALASGDLSSCTITASSNGVVEVKTVTPVDPGGSYEVIFPSTIRGLGTVSAFCTNADSQIGDTLGPQAAQFRRRIPVRPWWLQ